MNYLEKNIEQYKKDLAGLIKIDSWLRSENEYPFPQAKQALEYMIGLAKRDGMEITYVEEQGHYGYIEIGQGEELIGFLGHLDVVPPGEISSWNSDPFEMVEKDGKLFGRGTQDDKGPVMLSYYLMKELFEEGNLNKRVRLILATDEESFWRGIDKYKADGQEVLDYGIAPDSMFPVTYSERGLLQYKITSTDFPTNFTLTGGSAFNAVADVAEYKSGETSIKELGKPAHAMEPWKGDNAINKVISQLDEEHGLVKFAKEVLNNEIDGQTLMGKLIQDDDAPLTVNLGKVSINDKEAWLGLDSRLPNTITLEEFESKITEAIKSYGLTYERYDWLQPVFIPKDSQVIKDLMETYREITGDNTPEQASGGATYARAMENVVAFGPLFGYSEITEHQPNEHITIEEFIKVYDIYYKSFKKWLSH